MEALTGIMWEENRAAGSKWAGIIRESGSKWEETGRQAKEQYVGGACEEYAASQRAAVPIVVCSAFEGLHQLVFRSKPRFLLSAKLQ